MPAVPQLNYVQFTETTSTQKLKENYKILHQNKETFFFLSPLFKMSAITNTLKKWLKYLAILM